MRYQVTVREVVSLWVEVDAETAAAARAAARNPAEWKDWQEVPDVEDVWVPSRSRAEQVDE